MSALRSIPADFAADEVGAIDARLDVVVRDERVAIPLAIESGSRAWGFASPDSDYDCRFLYLRRRSDYLALWAPRDVIETPLDGLLDVNGWDVAKALRGSRKASSCQTIKASAARPAGSSGTSACSNGGRRWQSSVGAKARRMARGPK
eukprot:gene36119-biopygen23716